MPNSRAGLAILIADDLMTGQDKAGIVFPTGRLTRLLRQNGTIDRVSGKAGVALASALEFLCADILSSAGDIAGKDKKQRIQPRHIQLCVQGDDQLAAAWNKASVAQGGVLPKIQPEIEKKSKKTARGRRN